MAGAGIAVPGVSSSGSTYTNSTYSSGGNYLNGGTTSYPPTIGLNESLEDYQIRYDRWLAVQEIQANGKAAVNITKDTAVQQVESIKNMLAEGREDEVLRQFNGLVEMMREKFPEYSEADLRKMALKEFEGKNTGLMQKLINENCSSDFMTGLKQVPIIGFLLGGDDDTNSKSDLLDEICGVSKRSNSDTSKMIGEASGIAGCIATGATIGAIIGAGVPGAIVGGIIGGVVGLFGKLFS